MKKLKLGKFNLLSEEVLQRSQLAAIYGGSGSGGSQCCIHLRDSNTNAYLGSTCEMQDGTPITYNQAQEWYFMSTSGSGMWVSGYCCSSCN